MNKGSLFELMDEPVPQAQSQPRPQPMAATAQQRQQPQPQPMAVSVQQPPYPPQPQVPGSMGRDNRNSLRCGHLSNRRTDRFNTRPHHNRNTHSSLPYNRKTMAVRKSRTGRNRNSRLKTTGCNTPQTKKSITIPKDYEEYPDFPQSMLEPKYSPYQTV